MTYPVYYVPDGDTLPIFFDTFDGGTGASITLTGLAVTDIEIYKDGGVTQRASDAGYTLLDTDGIDFDGITGIHGFSIDTSDNTDAGFYTVGAWFHVVVSSVTIDGQTVNFIAAAFRIMEAESSAGRPDVNVAAMDANVITSSIIATDAIGAAQIAANAITSSELADNAITANKIATDAITAAKIAADAIGASEIAADAIGSSELATTAVNEIRDAILADSTAFNGADIAAILVDTNSLNDTKVPDTISLANINAEVDTAITDAGLDHLVSAAVIGTDVADNSIVAKLVSASVTADFDDFVNTTDSLQAIRDVEPHGTAMRGTDSALLAASAPTNFGDLSITATTGRVDVASIEGSDATDQINAAVDAALDTAVPVSPTADSINQRVKALDELLESGGSGDAAAILTDTADMQPKLGTPAGASISADIAALNDISVADILTTQMTEAYAADGVAPTLAQAICLIQQSIGDFSISGTTLTVKQLDGTTTAATYTLDDATDPTSRTRAT